MIPPMENRNPDELKKMFYNKVFSYILYIFLLMFASLIGDGGRLFIIMLILVLIHILVKIRRAAKQKSKLEKEHLE
jgi:hypothetical protein